MFKLLVWLFCAVVLVSQVQCRSLAGYCGVDDNHSNRRRRDASDHRWPAGSNLTYRVWRGPTHGVLKDADIGGLVTLAFREWAPHCGLQFTQIHSGEANITISFQSRAYWNFPISLLGGIAYVSDFPSKDIHSVQVLFDDDEQWSLVYTPGYLEFYGNLLHELGHALGLEHSDNYGSIMYKYYHCNNGSSTLQNDDISRIRKRYDIKDIYSGSLIDDDDVSHNKIIANNFSADVNQRNDSASTTTTDESFIEANTTESSERLSSTKNTTDESFVEASTTESSEKPLSSSKNTTDESFVEASTTESRLSS